MDEKIIHRVFLKKGEPGRAESLSVTDLWNEYRDAPMFFRSVLNGLANDRIYSDSGDRDQHCLYTTSSIPKLKDAVEAWYAREEIAHTEDTDSWYQNLLYA